MRVTPRGALLAAATILLALGLWRLAPAPRLDAPGDGSTSTGPWRGDAGDDPVRADLIAPIVLWVQLEQGATARPAPLEPVASNHWRTSVPLDANVQVMVARPAGAPRGRGWHAEAILWYLPQEGEPVRLTDPPLEAEARATEREALVGKALALHLLRERGVVAGERLELEIRTGGHSYRLDITLTDH